jgi:Tol biopolymer transport system component
VRDDASRSNPRLELSWIESASAAFVAGDAGTALGLIARWAPDGSALVFASLKDDQVYLVRARSREPIKLTSRGHNADPVFSPDGRSVYFSSDRSGRWQLWRQSVQGASAEQLTHDDFDNRHPYVAPDGRSVAFLSFENGAADRRALRDARLRRLSLADGVVEELAKLLGGHGSLAAYPWAPDGQHLAFVSYQRVPADEAERAPRGARSAPPR